MWCLLILNMAGQILLNLWSMEAHVHAGNKKNADCAVLMVWGWTWTTIHLVGLTTFQLVEKLIMVRFFICIEQLVSPQYEKKKLEKSTNIRRLEHNKNIYKDLSPRGVAKVGPREDYSRLKHQKLPPNNSRKDLRSGSRLQGFRHFIMRIRKRSCLIGCAYPP